MVVERWWVERWWVEYAGPTCLHSLSITALAINVKHQGQYDGENQDKHYSARDPGAFAYAMGNRWGNTEFFIDGFF